MYERQKPQSSAEKNTIKSFFLLYESPYPDQVVVIKGCNAYRLVDVSGEDTGTHIIVHLKLKY